MVANLLLGSVGSVTSPASPLPSSDTAASGYDSVGAVLYEGL